LSALEPEVINTTGTAKLVLAAFESTDLLKDNQYAQAVRETIDLLDRGLVRVAQKIDGTWVVNEWVKKAILLYFSLNSVAHIEVGPFNYLDKIPLKRNFAELGVRVVPPATARYGTFMERGAILMPSYVNIGAWIGAGTMIDTWATVGSCAQIGAGVHLSGGVGIGGVLEPPSASPVIVEDGAFVGSRAIIVEGALIETEAVIGANVTITSSTQIIDVTGSQPVTYRGRVPARVVVPGSYSKDFPAGKYNVNCALIIGQRKESTDRKTTLNSVLRDYSISV
jgi:2,3,4,5-tetrahydropyridine-2-carboxylate N-succinyltransferase